MKVLVTGGAGFVGSHVCEYYAKQGAQVVAYDNLSRAKLLGRKSADTCYNWQFLETLKNVKRVKADICDFATLKKYVATVDVVIHTAAQTAVTTSVVKPGPDFDANAVGTFNVLEAARQARKSPAIVICSTNKVYGENVNQIPIRNEKTRYTFSGKYRSGVSENLGIDLCEHTPYGCSKLAADIYAQDYARLYGLRVGVFRMSCIYGTRQFGVEDQGWLAWFVIAAVTGQPVTIYGDGKQLRDVLWVDDLIRSYNLFLRSKERHVVLNVGGGPHYTLSLLELLAMLKSLGFPVKPKFGSWRPSDQKVYISDIGRARKLLHWRPLISPSAGVEKIVAWVKQNKRLFR